MISFLAKAMVEPLDAALAMRAAEQESEARKARASRLAAWMLAWLPAIAALAWVCRYRMPVPFHDDWAFVMEYQRMVTSGFSWEELFRPINGHSLAVPKLVFAGVMGLLRGDLSLLPLLTWGLCVVSAAGAVWLSRDWRASLPGRGCLVVLLWNLGLFSAAQDMTWFWNCTFHHYLPGACLVAALVLLAREDSWVWPRLALAFALAAAATLSFGAGFLVPFLLMPMVARALRERTRLARAAACALWITAGAALTWVALFAYPQGGAHITSAADQAASLLAAPWLAVQYVLVLCGLQLGIGTAVEPGVLCAAFGLGILAALAWGTHRLARAGGISQALPWLIIAAWAAGNIGLITLFRLRFTVETALAPRYMANTHYLALAAVAVVAMVVARSSRKAASLPLRAAAWLLILGHLTAWAEGLVKMPAEHGRMRQERAAIAFVDILPPLDTGLWWYDEQGDTAATARFLRHHDKLKKARILASGRIADLRQGAPLQNRWSSWMMRSDETGKVFLEGMAAQNIRRGVDLVVISRLDPREGEVVMGLARPAVPEDFARREASRRAQPGRFFGWRFDIPPAAVPAASADSFRAYAYDGDTGNIKLIPHASHPPDSRLARSAGEGSDASGAAN